MELPVYRRVKAAVVSSGSEVVEPGTPLTPGKIYNTNTVYMKARLHQLGAQVMMSRTVGDELEIMEEALKEAANQAELGDHHRWCFRRTEGSDRRSAAFYWGRDLVSRYCH